MLVRRCESCVVVQIMINELYSIFAWSRFRLLHSLRACHDAVLIGINTLICDDPQLNVREPLPSISLPSIQPRSIIIDSKLRFTNIHMNMRLQNPLVITSVTPNTDRWVKAQSLLAEHGGQLVYCPCTIDGR